jgi:hypothetical protein
MIVSFVCVRIVCVSSIELLALVQSACFTLEPLPVARFESRKAASAPVPRVAMPNLPYAQHPVNPQTANLHKVAAVD